MYLAMDEFGKEYHGELLGLTEPEQKWRHIFDIAAGYGFEGIQLNSKVYEHELGLSLSSIPAAIRKYRLSYHVGGVVPLLSRHDVKKYSRALGYSLDVSKEHGVEDVSFHPPHVPQGADRNLTEVNLREIIEFWLPRFSDAKVSLSMESHVAIPYFVFRGLHELRDFADQYPDLGLLIDFSHNCFDGYSVEKIISLLEGLKITGLHLSDALPGPDYRDGTHLQVGRGVVDFACIVRHFCHQDIYAALEVKGSCKDIAASKNALEKLMGNCSNQ